MTLFVPTNSGQPEADDQPVTEAYASLVGEGKKYRDNEALAKSRLEADSFIETLKKENEEIRRELKSRISLEDALAKITAPASNAENSNQGLQSRDEQVANGENGTRTGLSVEDAERLFEKKLIETQREAAQRTNMGVVQKELIKAWGTDTEMILRAKTAKLGLTPEQVDTIAASNPTAALAMFGLGPQDEPRQGNITPPRNTGNMPVSGNRVSGGTKNNAYWQAMMKAQPDLYFSREMTIQRHQAAQQLGDKYYE